MIAVMERWHFLRIHDDVLHYLREHAVSEDPTDTMLVVNPRRYFENTAAY